MRTVFKWRLSYHSPEGLLRITVFFAALKQVVIASEQSGESGLKLGGQVQVLSALIFVGELSEKDAGLP